MRHVVDLDVLDSTIPADHESLFLHTDVPLGTDVIEFRSKTCAGQIPWDKNVTVVILPRPSRYHEIQKDPTKVMWRGPVPFPLRSDQLYRPQDKE